MSQNSKIEWTDHTFNPFIGCTKVSPGCDHCYAEHLLDTRMHRVVWGPHGERIRTSPANWRKPIHWNAHHDAFFAEHGRRQRVFCASLADVFDNAIDPQWRADLFDIIGKTPNLDWLLLSKRIGNVKAMLREVALLRSDTANLIDPSLPPNVWLGATIVNQEEADRDIPKLIDAPARVRFLSMEPLLGAVNLFDWIGGKTHELQAPPMLDWVIVGGESGRGARPMHPAWARSLRDQCASANVPFLFKQWEEWAPGNSCAGNDMIDRDRRKIKCGFFDHNDNWNSLGPNALRQTMDRIGRSAAGRMLDGQIYDGFPETIIHT